MRVKARLTTSYLQQSQKPSPGPMSDHNLDSLSRLFPADPIVTMDDEGWYLSATSIDQADDDDAANVPGRYMSMEAYRLLANMNGIAKLLRVAHGITIQPVVLTDKFDGRKSGARVRVGGVATYAHQTDYLDTASASELLRLAEAEPPVQRTLELLARYNSEWFWFDMYRIYEQVLGGFIDKQTFETWLDGLHAGWDRKRVEFEDSANNPSYGSDRRHGKRNYGPRFYDSAKTRPVQVMTRSDAAQFIRQLVIHWIEVEYGVVLDPQWAHIG
jgi:hypothetical protein